jgi:hypothetical protein
MRRDAEKSVQKAMEALNAAKLATEKAIDTITNASSSHKHFSSHEDNDPDASKDFETVNHKHNNKFQSKNYVQQTKQYKPREHKFVPKEQSDKQVAYYSRKKIALETAQEIMKRECLKGLPHHTIDDVNNQISFVIGYVKTIVVDVSHPIVIQDGDETFEFSRERFMENRFFQNHVRNEFASLVPDGWFRFFPGRNEGTFCISIKLRRN